jgi:hypothetical protein
MKFIKKIIVAVLVVLAVGFLSREWFYNRLITYKTIGVRQTYKATDSAFKEYIDSNVKLSSKPDVYQIVAASQEMTSSKLNFTTGKNDLDPNKLIISETAHCIGYANFFTTSCNYLLAKYDLSGEWKASTQIGQLYILENNIHDYLNSSFLKDHDFVTIENKISGEVIAVDPSLNDYFHIDYINFKK